MDIKTLMTEAHEIAIEKGWYDNPAAIKAILLESSPKLAEDYERYFLNSCLMNVASEIGEACEAVRHGDMENVVEEIADVYIRLADTCAHYGLNLELAITQKMAKNKSRPYMHGKKL